MQLQVFTFCADFLSFLCVLLLHRQFFLSSIHFFSVRFFPLHILFSEAPSQCNFNWLFFMRKRRESILVFHFAETIDFFLLVAFSFFFVLFPLILSILHIFSKLPVIVSKQLSYTWEESEREREKESIVCLWIIFVLIDILTRSSRSLVWNPCK